MTILGKVIFFAGFPRLIEHTNERQLRKQSFFGVWKLGTLGIQYLEHDAVHRQS